MNSSTEQIISNSLSLRLKQETAAEHERMHQLMSEAKVFSSKEKYAQFTLSQYYFQREIEHLFEKEGVAGLIPDLDIRGRSKQALADLNDLGIQPNGQQLQSENVQLPEALGWIYVSEGSTLGAAFLFKEAQKHLGFRKRLLHVIWLPIPKGARKSGNVL